MTDILTAAANGFGQIKLNPPQALHALNPHVLKQEPGALTDRSLID